VLNGPLADRQFPGDGQVGLGRAVFPLIGGEQDLGSEFLLGCYVLPPDDNGQRFPFRET